MARLQPIEAQFKIAIQATLEATQKLVVATAKREHGKIMTADPRPGSFRRWVDGIEGAREEQVKARGVIVYEYQRLDIVAQFAMETLFDRSPVGLPSDRRPFHPGLYRISHTLFLNEVAVNNLKDWTPGSEVVIANFVEYSRIIELGKMKMRVPGTDRVYQQAEQIVKRRFGNIADVRFTFRGIIGGGIASGRPGNKSENRFPALVIRERGFGPRR